jgi:hypothetical protein
MFLSNSKSEKVNSILTSTGLDFRINKVPMFIGEGVETPYFALVNSKSGNVINSVKDSYTVTQNEDIVGLVLDGISKFGDGLTIQKGGSLNDGRRVFLQLAIEGNSKVGDDTIKRYVTIIDSNDGSTGLSVGIGDFTMSCSNQFFKFYKAGQSRFRHTATIEQRVKEIPMLIELALSQSLQTIELYNKFASTPCTRDLAHKMVNYILGFDKTSLTHTEYANLSSRNENAMNTLYDHITKEMNQKGNNVWGLHSGVTSWTTHEKSAPRRENGRLESLMVGTNYRTNQASLEFASGLIL